MPLIEDFFKLYVPIITINKRVILLQMIKTELGQLFEESLFHVIKMKLKSNNFSPFREITAHLSVPSNKSPCVCVCVFQLPLLYLFDSFENVLKAVRLVIEVPIEVPI